MRPSLHRPSSTALQGWRARLWAWVFFAALLKGLVPHAALAAALMTGEPSLSWCAPGTAAEGANSQRANGASEHSCVCASGFDAAAVGDGLAFQPGDTAPLAVAPTRIARSSAAHRLPPARGPPA